MRLETTEIMGVRIIPFWKKRFLRVRVSVILELFGAVVNLPNHTFYASYSGDYQFDIYRMMRQHNGDVWDKFRPFTNVMVRGAKRIYISLKRRMLISFAPTVASLPNPETARSQTYPTTFQDNLVETNENYDVRAGHRTIQRARVFPEFGSS